MPIPDHVIRFWAALDDLFATVERAWWGAVVTDGRFPRIWDANYARVEARSPDLSADEVLERLIPAVRAAGADLSHVMIFHPEVATRLLVSLSSAGHRLAWDLVLEVAADPPAGDLGPAVEELPGGEELWVAVADSIATFGVGPEDAIAQLQRIEREVLTPGGKRWFGVRDRDRGRIVSLGALHLLEGVGYVDNVATAPAARGRGCASAVTARIVREARAAGAAHVFLLADPDDEPVLRLYGRLGFREVGRLASTKGPLPG